MHEAVNVPGDASERASAGTPTQSRARPDRSAAPGGAGSSGRPGANGRPARTAAGRLRFLARRFGFYLFTFWAAVTLNFVIPRFMPNDPADSLLRSIQQQTGQPPSPEAIAAVRRMFGDPTENLFQRYLDYWVSLSRFDFGISVVNYPVPVAQLVGQALPWTVLLVGVTTVLAWLIGTAIGAYLGWKPGGRFDALFTPATTFLHAIPTFWLSLLALWVFAFQLGWFPIAGGYDPNVPYQINNVWFLLSVLQYGALPAATLIFIGFNGWLFTMRNVMVTTVSEDYVLLAQAKGLSTRRVILMYAARNALLPNVTGLALAIGGVIGGVLLTEVVFTYPGMGHLLYVATLNQDFPVMQTIFLMITITVLLANLIADSIYVLLDPRTREATSR